MGNGWQDGPRGIQMAVRDREGPFLYPVMQIEGLSFVKAVFHPPMVESNKHASYLWTENQFKNQSF